MLDGTGINHSAVEVTAVEQLALGRIRLSGVPSDFAPGSVGERALKDFLFDLGGQAGSVACDANITRIATTLGADRPVIYVDNVGVSHYEQTVDLQFQVRHAANFFDVYRSTAFSNALFRINAARGYGINSTAYMLGQPVRRRPPTTPFAAVSNDRSHPPTLSRPRIRTSWTRPVSRLRSCPGSGPTSGSCRSMRSTSSSRTSRARWSSISTRSMSG